MALLAVVDSSPTKIKADKEEASAASIKINSQDRQDVWRACCSIRRGLCHTSRSKAAQRFPASKAFHGFHGTSTWATPGPSAMALITNKEITTGRIDAMERDTSTSS